MVHGHVLLIAFPAQGHINPALQLAKRLIRMGVQVTFATSVFAHRRMSKAIENLEGLKFAAFSDGFDDGFPSGDDFQHLMSELKNNGSETLRKIIVSSADEGRPEALGES